MVPLKVALLSLRLHTSQVGQAGKRIGLVNQLSHKTSQTKWYEKSMR
jgi:hypothetical protein